MAEQAQAGPVAPASDKVEKAPVNGSAGEAPRWFGLTGRQLAGLAAVVLVVQLPFLVYLLRGRAPVTAQVPFADDYNRGELGPNYFTTGGHWRIEDGVVHSPGVKNNPLWLKASLPDDVVVEFDARSESADGDIKCEIFGNGYDHASGYVIIFGGWSNSISIIARQDEHGPTVLKPRGPKDRVENRTVKVERSRTYRFRIERKGALLRWYVDGRPVLEYLDPKPLRGPGNDRFGFSSWDSDIYFDNLSIQPL